jgi:hypothetical protein
MTILTEPINDNVSILMAGDELKGELSPSEKMMIEATRKQELKGKLEALTQTLSVIQSQIKKYTANGNYRKLSIYQAKEIQCIERIEELEKLMVPNSTNGAGGD